MDSRVKPGGKGRSKGDFVVDAAGSGAGGVEGTEEQDTERVGGRDE